MRTIALDDDLLRLRSDLEREGFNVVDKSKAVHADAVVVSGLENDIMGMQDIKTRKKVIDASGKSAGEIVQELRNK